MLIKKYWDKIQLVSITSRSGDLYAGINNSLEVMFPEGETLPYKVHLTTNNGSIKPLNSDRFVTDPKFVGNSYVRIFLVVSNNDSVLVGRKKFTVSSIPSPCLKIGQTIIQENSTVNRKIFFGNDSLKLYFTNDLPESDDWYKIDFFNSGFTYGGAYFYEDNKGPILSKNAIDVIQKQLPGREMVIKVISVTPKAQHFRIMPIIRFKII
ncbi:MAG TPA: hypothetical protein VIH57_16670 [Bacteroidales bacterium]